MKAPVIIKQKSFRAGPSIPLVIGGIFLFLWLAGLTLVLGYQIYLNNLYDKYQTQTYFENYYRTTRVQFCFEHDIKPCDDIGINEWNVAHPDDVLSTNLSFN